MPIPCVCRLMVVGRKVDLKAFGRSQRWFKQIGARFIEALELSATRHIWQFETDIPRLEPMKRLSARFPRLVFLLDYDREPKRRKGLAKAKNGRLETYEVKY